MFPLNLPSYNAKIVSKEEKEFIFDPLRRRYVALTPEEWVRQNFINYLVCHKGYPSALLANEVTVELNGMKKRSDSVLFAPNGQPRMIMEYKAPKVEITQKVFSQISRYNNVLRVEYLIVSNGLQHFCCQLDYERMTYVFLKEIPHYSTLHQ